MILSSATLLLASDLRETNDVAVLGEIKQAAQEATKLFFPRAEGRKKTFGFEPEDVLGSATLGTPVELYTFNDVSLLAYHSGQPITSLIQPTGQWLIPVAIGGTNRAMIAVSQTDEGKWTGTTFGMAPLARKWQNIQAWWPATEKFTPKLIIWPAQGYFFSIPQVQPPNLTGLSDIPATHIDSQTAPKPRLIPAENSLTIMQETLKQTAHSESENNTNKAKSQ